MTPYFSFAENIYCFHPIHLGNIVSSVVGPPDLAECSSDVPRLL